MTKLFNFIRIKYAAKYVAVIALSIALVLQTTEFISATIVEGFLSEHLFSFLVDLATSSFIIYAILAKHIKLLEISVIVLKTFEGTYYPLRSTQRIDALIASTGTTLFYVINHIIFAVASGMMLVSLIVFCIFKVNDKKKYWNIMKLCILIAAIVMLVSSVLYTINIVSGGIEWTELLEPYSLVLMFLGVYATCEYIEVINDDTKETSAS